MVLKLLKSEAKIMDSLSLVNREDLLFVYPYRYHENELIDFSEWKINDNVFFSGRLLNKPTTSFFNKRSSTRFQVLYNDIIIHCTIFNRHWVSKLNIGDTINIEGKYTAKNKVSVSNYNVSNPEDNIGLFPIYGLSAGITINAYRKFVKKVYDECVDTLIDDLPLTLLDKYKLLPLKTALQYIHFPKSFDEIEAAKRTLKYREFLVFNVRNELRLLEGSKLTKKVKVFDQQHIDDFVNNLPFKLLDDQWAAILDILNDFKVPQIMTRLVQGDVGSGKTIVGAIAMYATVLSGQQAIFMAPTELLAIQQANVLEQLFSPLNIKVVNLYSGLSTTLKKDILSDIKSGAAQIVVGTHALFQDQVVFNDVGLIVVDEQQRFGVNQRKALINKSNNADLLMLSATPIPRTLASILFSDMAVSTISQKPKSRRDIKTEVILENSMKPILENVKTQLKKGHQIYVVTPAIESDEDQVLTNVETITKVLKIALNERQGLDVKISALHGKMDSQLKDQLMKQFVNNEIQILVSTTVIEVGLDNPNATMMIIYDAQQFGLSQLHQLRGRVGRGSDQSYCYLLSNSKDPEVKEKLHFLEAHADGFEVARFDLKKRGPGDVLGVRQSGLPNFVLGDIEADQIMLQVAKSDAKMITSNLDNPDYHAIIKKLLSE